MNCIYDLHSHILPGIDDGSKNSGESIRMLTEELSQGVSRIALTPHFYAQKEPVNRYLAQRRQAYERLMAAIEKEKETKAKDGRRNMGTSWQELTVKLAAEVYFFNGMGHSDVLRKLCLEGTDYVFVEMPFSQWTSEFYQEIYDILNILGLKVMIVHIERYYPFQKDKTIWNEVFALPVVAQINAGAFADFRERQTAKKFIKKGYPIVLGSDCHNMYSRMPNLKEGREYIEKKYGGEMIASIDKRSEEIWQGI